MRESKKERAVILAEQLTYLFGLAAMLIPDLDLLEETVELCGNKESFAASAAPIFGAMGMDYEGAAFDANFKKRRARAVYELVQVLRDTEQDRLEQVDKQERRLKAQQDFGRILGLG